MRIDFLGTGGYHPNERRHTTSVLFPEIGLAFDAGTGLFRLPERLQTGEIHFFLSHAHLDHIFGLTCLMTPLADGTLSRVRVSGNEKTLQAVREHLFSEALFPVRPSFEYVSLDEEMPVPGGGVLRHVPLEHPGGSTGYRVDWPDRSLAYITDTSADGSVPYLEFIRGVDLLIHECNFPDEMTQWAEETGHSHTTPVAEVARQADVDRLVLIHVDPQRPGDDPIGIETARALFPATELAEDRMTIEF